MQDEPGRTFPVEDPLFRRVYDSPSSLPGEHRWVTPSEDVREIEKLLGMAPGTIGAPLWVSGDQQSCPTCGRTPSWLDIIASGVATVHSPEMIARVILGEQKYVNTEAPNAIDHVRCHSCGTAVEGLRSFKCHNWAYAIGDLADVVENMRRSGALDR